MMSLICSGDKTHSQIIEQIPEKCLNSRDFESVLDEVRNVKPVYDYGADVIFFLL